VVVITSVFRYRAGHSVDLDHIGDADSPVSQERRDLLTALKHEVSDECVEDGTSFLWIHIIDPRESELALIGDLYGFSRLQIQDALSNKQRPKVETTPTSAFVIMNELRYLQDSSDVETGQIAVWVGRGYAVTTRHGTATPHSVRRRLAEQPELLANGPISVLYAVADVLVDGYAMITEHLDQDIERIEEIVFSDSRDYQSERIYHLKRENLEVKRAVSPLVGPAHSIERDGHPQIPNDLAPYFRDIIDHLLRTSDLVETHDQLLVTMLMAANAQQDLRQNQDMRKISSWAAIIAVPTAIAGIYGMNFDEMPELHWQFGYPFVVSCMVASCLILYGLFKRSGWL
jgi:magnesium transporter